MSYTPTVWKAGDVVSSVKLNKLENAVKGLADDIDEGVIPYDPSATYEDGTIGKAVGDLTRDINHLEDIKADKKLGKNLFTTKGRTRGTLSGYAATTKRFFNENEYYVGLSADGYYNASNIISYEVTDSAVSVQAKAGYALVFPIKLEPGVKYTFSATGWNNNAGDAKFNVCYYDDEGNNVGYGGVVNGTFTVNASAYWTLLMLYTDGTATEPATYTNLQLELGATATNYAVYGLNEPVPLYLGVDKAGIPLKVNADGNVSAENNIINRNDDVLLAAQAACKYGINSGGGVNNMKKFCALVMTDDHWFVQGVVSTVQYLNAMPFIDMGISLGDMAASYYNESDGTWYTNAVNASEKPFATILGNHDLGNNKSTTQSTTVANAFNKWIKPTRETIGISDLNVPYYAIHNSTHKISMIFLNNYDVSDAISSGNYVVSRGDEVISQAQVDWLLNELDSIPSDYTLILCAHSFPYSSAADPGDWTYPGGGVSGNSAPCYADLIPDIINTWKTGGNLTKTYAPQLTDVAASVTVDHSFASRGTGLFACHIVGHTHRDIMAHSATYPDQKVIGLYTACCDNWNNGLGDLPRIKGQKSEDAITVLSVWPDKKQIHLVRIGSNKTIFMKDRTMISLEYT